MAYGARSTSQQFSKQCENVRLNLVIENHYDLSQRTFIIVFRDHIHILHRKPKARLAAAAIEGKAGLQEIPALLP
ncbi:unnamed protein product [Nezara viridula]|uniref:Uncharacterized protein n=1 Tax=Nezara viridula TaxID=85310 RepID=A0A9P0EDB8_NEZVI|nr:unnamed protein product [Nezara viridula]